VTAGREGRLARLREERFDIVVIGGGITGAAAARDAARRGYRTALIEARDFGEGTSSRSSRLIHGGLRYLEQLELDLVFEASQERRTLLHLAPHMVRPLEFLFPLYEDGRVGKLKLDAGMWLYDALALFRNIERHQMLDADEVTAREPELRRQGLLGGARYFDAQVDDARLVLATVLGAAESGAVVASRLGAVGIEQRDGAVRGVRVAGSPAPLTGPDGAGSGWAGGVRVPDAADAWTIPARVVINATGPWTDATRSLAGLEGPPLLRPTRGTHIHVRRARLDHRHALIFESAVDSRIMFVLPWGADLTIIGTTDVDFEGDPADVRPTAGDVAYLLESANRLFPEADLAPADVVGAWAGLRPLVAEGKAGDEDAVSRDFQIREAPPGLLTIAGGKLTSHRNMAEKLIDRAAHLLEERFDAPPARDCDTARVPLPGGDFEDLDRLRQELSARAAPYHIPPSSVERLASAYGTRAGEVLELLADRPALREPLAEDLPYLAAEAVYVAREEMVIHLEDVLFRRTHLALEIDEGLEEAVRLAGRLVGQELGWDDARRSREIDAVLAERARCDAWRGEAT
jgi:glycerol-3-phosphate dehydrogenase